jgi:hypothetical protein
MWDLITTVGGWVLIGLVVAYWVRWISREREYLGNGKWRCLE